MKRWSLSFTSSCSAVTKGQLGQLYRVHCWLGSVVLCYASSDVCKGSCPDSNPIHHPVLAMKGEGGGGGERGESRHKYTLLLRGNATSRGSTCGRSRCRAFKVTKSWSRNIGGLRNDPPANVLKLCFISLLLKVSQGASGSTQLVFWWLR